MDLFLSQSFSPWLIALGLIILLWGIMLLLIMHKKTGPVTPTTQPLPPGYEPPVPPKQPSKAVYYWIGAIITLLIILATFFFNQTIQKLVFGAPTPEFNTEINVPKAMQENARVFDTTLARITAAEEKGTINNDTALLYKLYFANGVLDKVPTELRGVDDEQAGLDGSGVYVEISRKKDQIDPAIYSLMEFYLIPSYLRESQEETTPTESTSLRLIPTAHAQAPPEPPGCTEKNDTLLTTASDKFLIHYRLWGDAIIGPLLPGELTLISTECANSEQQAENAAATAYANSVLDNLNTGWSFLVDQQGLRAPKFDATPEGPTIGPIPIEDDPRIDIDIFSKSTPTTIEVEAFPKDTFEGQGVPNPPDTGSVFIRVREGLSSDRLPELTLRALVHASQNAYSLNLCDKALNEWSCFGTAAYYVGASVQHSYSNSTIKDWINNYLSSGQNSLFTRSSDAYLWWLYLAERHGANIIRDYFDAFAETGNATPMTTLDTVLKQKGSNLSGAFADQFYLYNLHSGSSTSPSYVNSSSYTAPTVFSFSASELPKEYNATSLTTGALPGFGYAPFAFTVNNYFADTSAQQKTSSNQALIPQAQAQDAEETPETPTADELAFRVDISGATGLIAKVRMQINNQITTRSVAIDNAGNASFSVKESDNIDLLVLTMINPKILTDLQNWTPPVEDYTITAQVNVASTLPDTVVPLPTDNDGGTLPPTDGGGDNGNGDDGGGLGGGDPTGGSGDDGGGLGGGDPTGGSGDGSVVVPAGVPTRLSEVISTATNYIFGFAGSLAVLFIVIGGFRYVISAGNEQMVASAKKTIQYAVVGLTISILALVLVQSVLNALTN